jgi:tRNA pseudouridine55 synthase
VVARVRRALRIKAVGHTGTLDPFATGLLVLLTGRATRLARFVEQQPKTYDAVARLGSRTDTDDASGTLLEDGYSVPLPDESDVVRALAGFLGRQRQRPPAYSAKKVSGARSYALARRGEAVELAEVEVTVHAIELLEYRPPEVVFRSTVSPGTYVRALGRDLGERLGTGAHLAALRRTAIGPLRVEDAVPLADLGPEVSLLPLSRVLGHLPTVELSEAEARDVGHGRAVRAAGPMSGGPVVLAVGGRVVAVALVEAEGAMLQPCVVLETA